MIEYNNGIRISDTGLWLDATRKVPFSFVSHAHSDHVRCHEKIIATPPTISLIKLRHRKLNAIPLNYDQEYAINDAIIKLYPAGHILGSAQILILKDNIRILYTGDFKIEKSDTAEPFTTVPADVLIMESTFGAPQYVFPKKWVIIEKMVKFIEQCFQQGQVPVVMGYRIGKAQEALKILGDLNYQISLHPLIEPVVKIYEQYGVSFKNYQTYRGEDLRNRILIVPPHLSRGHLVKKIWNAKKLILTGWAVIPDAKYRFAAHEAIPFSDHADYQQLIQYVHKVNARKIFITHGFLSFVQDLRREGFDADLLPESPQLSLF